MQQSISAVAGPPYIDVLKKSVQNLLGNWKSINGRLAMIRLSVFPPPPLLLPAAKRVTASMPGSHSWETTQFFSSKTIMNYYSIPMYSPLLHYILQLANFPRSKTSWKKTFMYPLCIEKKKQSWLHSKMILPAMNPPNSLYYTTIGPVTYNCWCWVMPVISTTRYTI